MGKSSAKNAKKLTFRANEKIGYADAKDDVGFLEECFVNTGAIDTLQDQSCPEYVVVGGTGTGKSAILHYLVHREERVKELDPEHLALTFVENSTVIRFFQEIGVNLEIFYRLLWKHVFVVELMRWHFHITDETSNTSVIGRFLDKLRKSKLDQEAFEYCLEYGDRFWQETNSRVREVTRKIEKELESSVAGQVQANMPFTITSGVAGGRKTIECLTEEERIEIQHLGQQVVDKQQIQKIERMITVLKSDITEDPQKRYFITIDRLDEGWVDDALRYHLIRALLETAHDVNSNIPNVKIVIAIREDLLERVFRYTRGPGYQEEKYRSLYLRVVWNEPYLLELLKKRINKVLKDQYTKQEILLTDVLPSQVHANGRKVSTTDYILERTLCRPRDVINFFNECISGVGIKGAISQAVLFSAEERYSEHRLRAIADEWSSDYTTVFDAALFFRGYPSSFGCCDINNDQFEEYLLDYLTRYSNKSDCRLYKSILASFSSASYSVEVVLAEFVKTLFVVSVLGVQAKHGPVRWAFRGDRFPTEENNCDLIVHVHPAFWKVLRVKSSSPS